MNIIPAKFFPAKRQNGILILLVKKLPSIQSLKQEYAALQAENKKRYPEQKQVREKMMELLTAKNNVERILGMTEKQKNHDRQWEKR